MNKDTRPFIKPCPSSLLLIALLWALSWSVRAELEFAGTYYGFQFSDSRDIFDPDFGGQVKENRGHLKGKYGWLLNDLWSLETQVGLTTNSSSNRGILTVGAYGRVGKDFGQYKPYGLIGVSGLYAYDDVVDDVSETGGSLGGGLEIFGNKNIAITVEYVRMLDKSVDEGDLTFDTFGIGFTYYFIEDLSYFNKNRNKIQSIRY